jgi:hypothetical protein
VAGKNLRLASVLRVIAARVKARSGVAVKHLHIS